MHGVKNQDGVLVTGKEEILECYEKYFEKLLTTTNKKTEAEENRPIVEKVENKFKLVSACLLYILTGHVEGHWYRQPAHQRRNYCDLQ